MFRPQKADVIPLLRGVGRVPGVFQALAAALILLPASSAALALDAEPQMTGEVRWSAADSPVIVQGEVEVEASGTLIIDPGVEVRLGQKARLLVQGRLDARGTKEKPISFIAGDPAGPWTSVVLTREDGALSLDPESHLEWCRFSGARQALVLDQVSPQVRNCTFTDNKTDPSFAPEGGAALYITGGSRALIRDCIFRNNETQPIAYGGAVYVKEADPTLQDNLFEGNLAVYGGGLATDRMAGPIVGNTFKNNEATLSEGGGVSLISTCSAFLGNRVISNKAAGDGAGVHVCVTCDPHANPSIMDNEITGNKSAEEDLSKAAGGVGAAYLRTLSHNNIYDNTAGGEPSDLGWFHVKGEYPDWVADLVLRNNWWGTTDPGQIEARIYHSADNPDLGTITPTPAGEANPLPGPPRVIITTRRIRYKAPGEEMPVFLTIYNPGPAREVLLSLILDLPGQGPMPLTRSLAESLPETDLTPGGHLLSLDENSVFFTILLSPPAGPAGETWTGTWYAALLDPTSGALIGEVSEARFEISTTEEARDEN